MPCCVLILDKPFAFCDITTTHFNVFYWSIHDDEVDYKREMEDKCCILNGDWVRGGVPSGDVANPTQSETETWQTTMHAQSLN